MVTSCGALPFKETMWIRLSRNLRIAIRVASGDKDHM